jgi:parallel beta-helix repeat protein
MMRFLLSLACASSAVLCAQTILNPFTNLQTAVANAQPGAVLALNPGVYPLDGPLVIDKPITIRRNGEGPSFPMLSAPLGANSAIDIRSSNVRVESLQMIGAKSGVRAGGDVQTSNVTIRKLTICRDMPAGSQVVCITQTSPQDGGNGIYLRNVVNAVIDGNSIGSAALDGIHLDPGCTNALVINNNISNSGGHGIAVLSSDAVLIAGNPVSGAKGPGIGVYGSLAARVERNAISFAKQNGILITDRAGVPSRFAYVGGNLIGLSSSDSTGSGISLSNQSNGAVVYGNSIEGAHDNGLAVYNTSNAWIWGNVTKLNRLGGIFVHGNSGPAPSNIFIQSNHAHSLGDAGINIYAAGNATVFNNTVRNAPTGILLQSTSGNEIYLNQLQETTKGIHAAQGSTASRYFLNRHLTAMTNTADPGTSVFFDGGPVFGGNYQAGGKVLTDFLPYAQESLGREPGVTVLLPAANTAASSVKTIEWQSTGCTYVGLSTIGGQFSSQTIEANYPDTGLYRWQPPTGMSTPTLAVQVVCKDSTGQTLTAATSAPIPTPQSIVPELLAPQSNHRVVAGSAVKVAWRYLSNATTPVTVFYRPSPTAPLVALASNVVDNEVTVTVPGEGTHQGQFTVTVESNGHSDSTDGFVNVRDTTPTVIAPSGNLGIGTLQLAQWQSHTNSYYVDLEYWDPMANTYRSLATNLPDVGRYWFLVPDKQMIGSRLRVRFKDADLSEITTAISASTFNTDVTGIPTGMAPAAPTIGQITPASGSSLTQTFSVTYSDANGVTDLAKTYLMVNPTINGAQSCLVEFDFNGNMIRLMNDAGSAWSAPMMAGSIGTLSNSKCTVGASMGLSSTSNSLTVQYQMAFAQAEPFARNTYALAIDNSNLNSGWQQVGTWNIPPPKPVTNKPELISLTPTNGAGTSATFTAVFRHPDGAAAHYLGYLLVLPTPNFVSFGANRTCLIEYNRISNGMRLINSEGTNWIGPPEGVRVTPATAPLTNDACTVNVGGASAVLSGTDMIVTVPVTFKGGLLSSPARGTFIQANDVNDNWTDFRQFGNWVVPDSVPPASIAVAGATPQSGGGNAVTLTVNVSHASFPSQISEVHVRFNTAIVGGAPCHAVYFAQNNTIALVDDAGTSLIGPVALGTPLNNGSGRCSLTGGSRTAAGPNLALTLPFTFNAATFAGAKKIYVVGFDGKRHGHTLGRNRRLDSSVARLLRQRRPGEPIHTARQHGCKPQPARRFTHWVQTRHVERPVKKMAWLLLFVAGLFEICWAVGLKYTDGFTRPLPTVLTISGHGGQYGPARPCRSHSADWDRLCGVDRHRSCRYGYCRDHLPR